MGRVAGVLVVLVASLALWVAPAASEPAGARHDRPLGLALTGTFAGTSDWRYADPSEGCEFVLQEYAGTFDPDRWHVPGGTFSLDVCVHSGPPVGFAVTGTFEVTSGRLSLLGTVDGTLSPFGDPPTGLAIDYLLTVTESRGTIVPVRGTIDVAGTELSREGAQIHDAVGTFTAHLRLGQRAPMEGAQL